jgi:hypothetical protein
LSIQLCPWGWWGRNVKPATNFHIWDSKRKWFDESDIVDT